ncbi:hypothetical protein ACGFY0_34165 [Streptomyces chartreusis]|uniref:hypothetical protein n=1 Tax=Streptomyces chartreusis TaxID=1969 RepID=UPI003712D831
MPNLTAAGFTCLDEILDTTQHYRHACAYNFDATRRELINFEHRLILEAIKRGNSGAAERFLAGYLRHTLSRYPGLFAE